MAQCQSGTGDPASASPSPAPEERPVLVVDLGGQYSQLIARRVREARVYSELVSHRLSAAEIAARNPAALVLSGGPASVYAEGAPLIDEAIFSLGVPTLGICYGMQLMARDLGGAVERTGASEFGKTELEATESELFHDLPQEQTVWMSHGDSVTAPPTGATVTASSPNTPIAAFEDRERHLYGVQFHPEVVHTPHGQEILKNFLYEVAGAPRPGPRLRSSRSRWSGSAPPSAPSGSCALSRAASTRPSPRSSCTRRSAISSRASSSTTGCFARTRRSRSSRRSRATSACRSSTSRPSGGFSTGWRASRIPRRSARSSARSSSACSRRRPGSPGKRG